MQWCRRAVHILSEQMSPWWWCSRMRADARPHNARSRRDGLKGTPACLYKMLTWYFRVLLACRGDAPWDGMTFYGKSERTRRMQSLPRRFARSWKGTPCRSLGSLRGLRDAAVQSSSPRLMTTHAVVLSLGHPSPSLVCVSPCPLIWRPCPRRETGERQSGWAASCIAVKVSFHFCSLLPVSTLPCYNPALATFSLRFFSGGNWAWTQESTKENETNTRGWFWTLLVLIVLSILWNPEVILLVYDCFPRPLISSEKFVFHKKGKLRLSLLFLFFWLLCSSLVRRMLHTHIHFTVPWIQTCL